MYGIIFHDWVYIDYQTKYYGTLNDCFDCHESIHFVSTPGVMTNRHHELLQLAIL